MSLGDRDAGETDLRLVVDACEVCFAYSSLIDAE